MSMSIKGTPSRRFRDPTPQTAGNPQQPMMGAYPTAPPQPTQYYNQQQLPPNYGQQQGYYQGAPAYGQQMAPQGDPAYPPPPPSYPPQMQPVAPPPAYPTQPARPYPTQPQPVYNPQQVQTTVVVRERRRSSGDGAMMLVGGLAMGAMMGAALSGSFSSLGSFD